MASSDMKLDLIISAQDLTSKEIEGIKKKLEDLTKSTSETWKNSDGVFSKMKLGWAAVWTAIVYAGSKLMEFWEESVKIANSYESAFAWVKKTVDGTTADFVKLDNTLKKMSKTIPSTYVELAWIMELGGQLGVWIDDLEKFTTTIAELGTATNLTNEDAAQMLAQFANITWMDLSNIDRLGATIVDLWNNFATTEADIVNFASRIAGAGNIAWLNESQIMGIATAFSSVWIEAEAWGTAVQKVLLQMNNAATLGGDSLIEYSKAIGVTTEEFKELRNTHPEEVFQKFLTSLNDAWSGASKILQDLELKDERLTRAFLSLWQNSEILTDAISRGNDAWNENIALVNEANQRYTTTESQLIMLQNERANAMEAIWEKLQGVELNWERIKTAVVETAAELMGANLSDDNYVVALEGQVKTCEDRMKILLEELKEGKITTEEYGRLYASLVWKIDDYNVAIDEQTAAQKELEQQIENTNIFLNHYISMYQQAIETEWEGSKSVEHRAWQIEKARGRLEQLTNKLNTFTGVSAENAIELEKNSELVWNLEVAESELLAAQDALNKAQYDSSVSQKQMDALKKKAEEARVKVLNLRNELAQTVWKALGEFTNKLSNSTNPMIAKLWNWLQSVWDKLKSFYKPMEKATDVIETVGETAQETEETIVDTNTTIWASYTWTAKKISDAEKEIEKADKEHEKIIQELIDSYKKLDEQDAQSTFKKIGEETDNAFKKATSLAWEIEKLNEKLADLWNKKDDDIADAFLEAEEKAKSLEKEFTNIESLTQNISKDWLENLSGEYGWIDVDKIKEYIVAKETMASAFAQGTEEEKASLQALIDWRREYNELNKVEQILLTYQAEKEELEKQRQEKMEAFQEEQENVERLAKEKMKYEQEYFDKLNYDYVKEREMYDSLIQKARELAAARASAWMGGVSWARAEWGPVTAWSTYLVWERGPELFVPKTSGEIVPNEDLNRGGGDINIEINGTTVNNQSDIDSLVDTLIRRIKLEKNFWIA